MVTYNVYSQDDKSYDFKIVDVPPITSDCNPNMNNAELKTCFTKSVSTQIVNHINIDFLSKQGLDPGYYTVKVYFSIGKNGKVKKVKAEFQNEKIAKHFIDAVKSIRKMKPAYLDGKSVTINYMIPLKFKID